MKKTLILAVVAVAALTSSCRKDRTCTCSSTWTSTYTQGGVSTSSSGSGNDKFTLVESKKSVAKLYDCYDKTTTSTSSGGTGTGAYTSVLVTDYTCELK